MASERPAKADPRCSSSSRRRRCATRPTAPSPWRATRQVRSSARVLGAMFIFNKHLDRRTFLQGMGATVALPLLDAMIPAFAKAATRAVPRMVFVYFPHGAVMDQWTPVGEGPNGALGEILEPLAPFQDRVTIVSGIDNTHA